MTPNTKRQLTKVLLVAVTVSLGALAWLGWTIRRYEQAFRESMRVASELLQLSDRLTQLHEALMASARLATETDDPKWQESYERSKRRLDQVIEDLGVDSESYARETAMLLLAANMHVIRSEFQALGDDSPEARQVGKVGAEDTVESSSQLLTHTIGERIRRLTELQVETSRRHFGIASKLGIGAFVALLGAWMIMLVATQRNIVQRLSTQRVLEDRERFEKLRSRVLEQFVTSQEEQSRRLAQELHDGIGQCLTFLLIGLKTLEDMVDPSARAEHSTKLRALTSETIEELGRLAKGLHPSVLEDLGIVTALQRLRDDFVMAHRIRADLQLIGLTADARLRRPIEATLYRIIQEALNNVAKHAAAGTVSIILDMQSTRVRMIVEDDGCGFDTASAAVPRRDGGGRGLQSIRERVGLLNGTFAVESSPGQGTTLYATIPL